MMLPISQFKDEFTRPYHTKSGCYSDTIYTFDIETTSMFYINGKWQKFDPSIKNYSKILKTACPYIGMFSVNDRVYEFRNMYSDFKKILETISNPNITKTVWVHNLGYEFAFYEHVFAQYTIVDMVAREPRVPISFKIQELNIIFRCSLRLVEMSLEKAAKEFTNVHKAVGDLNYELLRSPKSVLSDTEKYYCEMDCRCLTALVRYFLKDYKHIKAIPLTQTGIMRKAYAKIVPAKHNQYIIDQLPKNAHIYRMINAALWGGITHGNIIHINQLVKNVTSYDIASSYPYVMCAFKYPSEAFYKIPVDDLKKYPDDDYAKLISVTFYQIESKLYNHYIPFNKCDSVRLGYYGAVDNGRLIKADMIHLTCTEIDYQIIKACYDVGFEEIDEVYISEKKYLPKYFIEFILDLYGDKTKLKGIQEKKQFYNRRKQILNSCFGACCTNVVKSSVTFDEHGWHTGDFTDEMINDTLQKKREAKNNLFAFHVGAWVTAYARFRLWSPLLQDSDGEFDSDLVYYDTDSLKMVHGEKYAGLFSKLNDESQERLKQMCLYYNIDYERCAPIDLKGHAHPLGEWENETSDDDGGLFTQFKTLGAKRYCYRQNRKLHLVVAGVGKPGVKALKNNINNFNNKMVFDYEYAGKLIHSYTRYPETLFEPNTFTDYQGNEYYNNWKCGVVLFPTTYSMSTTDMFNVVMHAYETQRLIIPDFVQAQKSIQEKKFEVI